MNRKDVNESLLAFNDLIYAAARITGNAEVNDTDALVYSRCKSAGLLRNLQYSSDRNLTKSETAQLLYNIISVPVNNPISYIDGVAQHGKETSEPILQAKYDILLKKGVVMSVFGESIFNENELEEDQILIDGIIYNFNTDENRNGLVGRSCVYFLKEEEEIVAFAEPLTTNKVYELKYNTDVNFKADKVEYELEQKKNIFNVNAKTIVVYNGLAVGTYTSGLMKNYYGSSSKITAIDNDKDNICNVVLIKKCETFVAACKVGVEGIVTFDYGMTFEGKNYIDLIPDDKNTHITVLENERPADLTSLNKGDLISIYASANNSTDKYITIELASQMKNGVLDSVGDDLYYINGKEYYVAETLRNAYKNNNDLPSPKLGNKYTFFIDITGQIANVTVPEEYKFGYLVEVYKDNSPFNLECNVKIFRTDGEMFTAHVADKVKLNINASVSHTYKNDSAGFINEILAEAKKRAEATEYNGDYRSIILYKLNERDELTEMWLPLNNTNDDDSPIVPYGETGYPLTKDRIKPGGRSYYGVIWGSANIPFFSMGLSVPIFNVPGAKDANDRLYSIKTFPQSEYNGYLKKGTVLYSVDKYNAVGAAVLAGATTEGEFDSYEELFVVNKIVYSKNEDDEDILKVFGWLDGEETVYSTTELDLISDAEAGWEVVKFDELKFGDVIQTFQIYNDVRRFRVIYRASNPGTDRIQKAELNDGSGATDGSIVKYGSVDQRIFSMGSFYDSNAKCLRISQDGKLNNFLMYSSRTTDVYILNMREKKLTKTSVSDLINGDIVMLAQTWGAVDDVFVVR